LTLILIWDNLLIISDLGVGMYICLCRSITDKQIREAVKRGACSMRDLNAQLGVATQCGKCTRHARALLPQAPIPTHFSEMDTQHA
jgi:bacterioferritin-associated ferredoxin